jgi:hypothetical protein
MIALVVNSRLHPRHAPSYAACSLESRLSASSSFAYLLPKRLSDEDSRPERAQRVEGSRRCVFNSLCTLSFSVSPKSFVSHSYENCRGVYPLFPKWNRASDEDASPDLIGRELSHTPALRPRFLHAAPGFSFLLLSIGGHKDSSIEESQATQDRRSRPGRGLRLSTLNFFPKGNSHELAR